MAEFDNLKKLCQLIRYDILTSTTEAGSGHPTSSLSAVELLTTLFFGGFFKSDLRHPKGVQNDRFILSKGHASPLIYALYHAARVISYQELMRLRKFNSDLEGHPTFRFKYADIATGSLGQGLSAGVGMALGMRLRMIEDRRLKVEKNLSSILNPQPLSSTVNRLPSIPKVFVLLGDSEMAEGQVWEAIQIASHYKLNNLIAIADINRLGQSKETMLGWDLKTYAKRIEAFGWRTIIVNDGHDLSQVYKAFNQINQKRSAKSEKSDTRRIQIDQKKSDISDLSDVSGNPISSDFRSLPNSSEKPTMILARTIKGKGVSFLENKEGWHGKPVPKEQLKAVLKELGKVDINIRGKIQLPKYQISNIKYQNLKPIQPTLTDSTDYKLGDLIATRLAYGDALVALGNNNEKIIVFDAEVSNSTYSEKFAKKFAHRYFEMFIAEQNMISTALGLSKLGFILFVSTFAAFLTRGFDQLRMAQYSAPNLKIVGSHCGVSIGPDGPSQMGLEDLAMFRSILNSNIFYPADAISTFKLTEVMANKNGLFYLRTNRKETPVIYENTEEFKIGGSKIHTVRNGLKPFPTNKSKTLIIAAGVTLHEALKAQKELAKQGIETIVLDCYSVKPLDHLTIQQLTINNFIHLCVHKLPRSGSPEELLRFEEIDSEAIIKAVKKLPPSSLISP